MTDNVDLPKNHFVNLLSARQAINKAGIYRSSNDRNVSQNMRGKNGAPKHAAFNREREGIREVNGLAVDTQLLQTIAKLSSGHTQQRRRAGFIAVGAH